jgi:ParB-like chromosome segregation protein Spo0J
MMDTIPLSQIDNRERKFCLSYPLNDTRLRASIEKVGIIEPLILLDGPDAFLVTGFKRLESARQLNIKKVPVVRVRLSEKEALFFAIHSNLNRGFNSIEKALALEKLVHMDFSEEEIQDVMALFSLSPHEKVLKSFLSIASAEKPLKDFVLDYGLSMKNIEYMLRFDGQERKKILRKLTTMRLTESYIREILEMLHLAKIKKGGFDQNILKGVNNAEDLRIKLKKKIHPGLLSLEKKLEQIKKIAALPPGIDIKVDPFFEKEYIDIVIRTKNEQDAKEHIRKLNEVLEEGHIRSILELTKGRVR